MASEAVQQPRRKREVFNPLKRGAACARCRRAKLRCDGVKPACSRCCKGGLRDCAYGDGPSAGESGHMHDMQNRNVDEGVMAAGASKAFEAQASAYVFGHTSNQVTETGAIFYGLDSMASSTDHFNNPAGTALSLGVTVTYDQTDSAVPTTGTEGDSTSPMQGLLPDKFGAQYSVEAGPSNTAALTPNTEAILQQFLDLPTPIVEQTLNFSNQPMVEDTASGQLALYNHGDQSQVGQQHIRANGLILEPPLPMYNAPPMLPTGLNLLGPSSVPYSGNPSEMQRFLSTLTGDAVAYHLNLPANNRAKELQIGTLGEDNGSQSSSSTYVQEAICPTGLPDLAYSYIFSNEGDTPRNTKEPIEVPPFVREKLLRVYLDSQHRCPGFYVNQKRLFNRLSGTLEDRPHPSWLFSMYLEGTRWTEDPALRNMEAHFYSVAKEHFDLGKSKSDRALDLTRTAINLALYLMRSDKEEESIMMAMHAVSMARTCGCLIGRHKRGSQWTGFNRTDEGPLRQIRCSLDVPEDDDEIQERIEVAATIIAMETFSVMATARPYGIDTFLTIPLQYLDYREDGSPPHFVTLQGLLDGESVVLSSEERPSGTATRIAVALLGHVFRLTFSSRQEIGQQHRLAKAATDAFVAAFPPSWHDIPNFVDDRPNPVVTERQVLVALWCTIHIINAYICEIDPSLTNERPIDHARKIIQYLPMIQEKISAVPMHMTIYLEFAGRALAEEAIRLRSSGWEQPAQTLDSLSEMTMTVMSKVARVYNLHDRTPRVSYEMQSQARTADSPPFALNTQNSQSDSSSTAHI